MGALSNPLNPIFLALYAEIHYTLRGLISRLKRNQPEIIADTPFRLNPGYPIPILCVVKDADKFPIRIEAIRAEVKYEGGKVQEYHFALNPTPLKQRFWFKVLHLPPKRGYVGKALIKVYFRCSNAKRSFEVINHNYKGSSNYPLEVYLSAEPLPTFEGWHYGEPHYHSFYTDDHAEFGGPVVEVAQLARAMGLDWLAITDHSFDLDDLYGNPVSRDPSLNKWKRLREEINRVNQKSYDFVTILGEEISCGNAQGKNIHLLAYGINNYLPGAGDSMEKWFRTRPDLSLPQVLEQVSADGGVAYAAHPEAEYSIGQRVLTGRGNWRSRDYKQPGLSGVMFWNGADKKAFQKGYRKWVRLLLEGRHLYFIGGNDAHGDFNRFRQLRIPLVMLQESQEQVFGMVRTCLYCPGPLTRESILEGLRKGKAVVTNGPLAIFTVKNESGHKAMIGESIEGKKVTLNIRAKSTNEFGDFEKIIILRGDLKERKELVERVVFGEELKDPKVVEDLDYLLQLENPSYVRLEVVSQLGQKTFRGYTNPIWINP